MALTHKHMSLYYSIAFFAHLLGKAIRMSSNHKRSGNNNNNNKVQINLILFFIRVLLLGVVVLATMVLMFWPWIIASIRMLMSSSTIDIDIKNNNNSDTIHPIPIVQVFRRLFPFSRGVFEDYVANFWCCSNPIFKWKSRFSQSRLIQISGLLTICTSVPSAVQQVMWPSTKVITSFNGNE